MEIKNSMDLLRDIIAMGHNPETESDIINNKMTAINYVIMEQAFAFRKFVHNVANLEFILSLEELDSEDFFNAVMQKIDKNDI
jgi:hypothetical protein